MSRQLCTIFREEYYWQRELVNDPKERTRLAYPRDKKKVSVTGA